MSTEETLKRKISFYLRRWLCLPCSHTSTALYGRSNKLQILIGNLEDEFRVSQTKEALVYRDSSDSRVAGIAVQTGRTAGIMVRTGRKFGAQDGLEQAESHLKNKVLLDTVTIGQTGLGAIPQPWYDGARGKSVAEAISSALANNKHFRSKRTITFVRAGEKPPSKPTPYQPVLNGIRLGTAG